ncbi:ROK family protein [Gramella sp. MAR_2010_147]|uniref:ROK family protein n=1 Tax=Gramella sp. MAR_2010_147 TaxID=1250205 RepID=UPI00087B76EB|nr:ROK family protein [Gramella sp. MAR_2010_147]SDS36759.1 glucokinase [Gramella sp. MAR_2010_147]
MKKKILGIDIGGTKIQLGIVQESKVIHEKTFPTLSGSSKEDIVLNIIKEIEALGKHDFEGIGIGVPGLVDEKEGVVYDLLNISSWKEVHLKKHLEKHFKIPVKITNDANVFALGEKTLGEGKKYTNMVGITMGTGFGTGIIANNQLYSGSFSSAGELGSLPYLDKTIEDYCSGKFFRREYDVKGTDLYLKAEKGDEEALRILEEFGIHLGNAIKTILFILSPEAIFLGGSVSKSFKFFEAQLKRTISDFPFKKVLDQLVIKPSDMENTALLGAASLIISKRETSEIQQSILP